MTAAPGTDCPLCHGLGEALREDRRNNGRLFAWPCPMDCPPGGAPSVRVTVTPERARKAGQKALRKAGLTEGEFMRSLGLRA